MHFKDVKDPIEIRPPGSNRGFILFRGKDARDRFWFFLFGGGPLDLCHGPAVEGVVNKPGTVSNYAGFSSPRQFLNRFEYGPAQLIHLSAVQSPVKGSTDIGAVQPQLDVTLSVNHGILHTLSSNQPLSAD